MRAVTRTGMTSLSNLTTEEASIVGRHDNAVRQYLDTGDTRALEPFDGVEVQGHELETSPDALDWYALTNDIRFEDIYEETDQ